jgi:protocatechuate 3,4-dioxygenase beta subunit
MTRSRVSPVVAGWLKAFVTLVVVAGVGLAPGTTGLAQTPARDQRGQPVVVPTGAGSLGGTVLDTEKKPVARATVAIAGDMQLSRANITDAAGRFLFTDLPAGRFTVTAEKGGYPSVSYGATRPNRPGAGILLAAGQAVTDIVLTLARGAVITGTVFDEHGQPMPEVPVQAWQVRTSLTGDRSFNFVSPQELTSDDRGMFRIFGLPPGEYTIGTSWFYSGTPIRVPTDGEIREAFLAAARPGLPPPAPPPPPPVHYSYGPTYAPSTGDPLSSSTLTLGPGEVREGVDLHMQLTQTAHIEGDVTGLNGAPVPDAGMVLFRRNKVGPHPTTHWGAGSDGHFTTSSLGPGDYGLLALVQPTADTPLLWAMADVTLSGPEPAMVPLHLQPALTLTGRIVFDGGPNPPDPTKARLSLQPLEGTNAIVNGTTVKIEPTGTFAMTGVTPGRFLLNANMIGAPTWQVASLTIGGQDGMDLPVEIGAADPPPVVVTFTDRASDLSGVVSAPTGQRSSDFFVVAIPADRVYWTPGSRRIRSTRPGTDGRYVFTGLPAGQYVLSATTDLTGGDLQDPSVLGELAAQAIPVTLGAGEKKIVDLKLGGGSTP